LTRTRGWHAAARAHTHTRARAGRRHPPMLLPRCPSPCACACICPQVLQMIPENNHVGLITFGTHVHVHELGYAECSKAFVFRGSKEYTSAQVRAGACVCV
jgi:hypothetical protein